MNNIEELQRIIDSSSNIVFFGGAGVSTESGIKDFRSKDGLYNQVYDYPPEEILSHTFYKNNPEVFFKFYFDKLVVTGIEPNECHKFLVSLEKSGKLKAIVTQNIDGLHELAGSKNVLNLHGTIYKNTCEKCHKKYTLDEIKHEGIPKCSCGGIIKPDVVLYEEELDSNVVNDAIKYISECDTIIVGGTSLNVYPAAGLIRFFKGKNLVVINLEKINQPCTLQINEKIGETFSKIKLR